MKRKSLLILLLLAAFAPWTTAQAQETLTVADGTETNGNIPIYGFYADEGVKCEYVIPAEQLGDMANGTISAMTLYLKQVSYNAGTITPSFTIFLKEVDNTTLTAFTGSSDAVVVFNNTIEITTSTTEDKEIAINFTTEYDYNGGNLLVGFYQNGTSDYKTTNWYGVNQSYNSAWSGYGSSSSASGSGKKFIPKTTFTYEIASGDCPNPKTLVASNETAHGATMTWTMEDETLDYQFNLEYKKTTEETWVRYGLGNIRTITLDNLDPETEYQVRIQTVCDPENDKWKNGNNFTTLVACPPPTNLDVTDGSVTARQATVTWEGTSSDGYVVMIGEEIIFAKADFETGSLSQANFTTTTSYPFTVVANTHSGAYCAKSGNGGINSSTSDMVLEVTLAQDATLTFSAKVSSESNYDKAYFSIDGTPQSNLNGISGDGNWIDYTYSLTAGTHTLRWYYYKDSSTAYYDDCFYVDDIVVSAGVASWTEYTTANPTYTFENLTPGTDYQVKVKGNCGIDGYSAESDPMSFKTHESCPTPTDLAVTTNSITAIVTWTGTTTDYNIDINGTVYNNVTSPYEFDVELSTTYIVKVQANCDSETSNWTDPVSITTLDCLGGHTIEYTLNDSYGDGWNGASITFLEGCDKTNLTLSSGSSTSGTLNICAEYFAFIWNNGNFDNECSFTFTEGGTTLFTKPSTLSDGLVLYTIGEQSCVTPTGLTAGTPEKRSVELSWTSEGEAWQICLNDDETNLIDVTENPYVLEGLDPATTYSVKIRTNCGDKQSCWTDNESFTTAVACLPVGTLAEATEVKSTSAKLSWALTDNTQTEWEVAYKTATDADFTSVEATTNIGFLLEGLTAETEYTVKVRANCGSEDGYSAWSNEITFTTVAACSVDNVTSSDVMHYTATVNWDGESASGFTVKYREAQHIDGISDEFGTSAPQGWSMYSGLLQADGTASMSSSNTSWSFGEWSYSSGDNFLTSNHARVNIFGNYQRWLVTPAFTVSSNTLSFDVALSAYYSSQTAPQTTGTDDRFIVLVSTDDMATWSILREWNNTGSEYVYNNINSTATGEAVSIDMSAFDGQEVYVAFYGESTIDNADNLIHIDNVVCGNSIPATEWVSRQTTENTINLENLNPGLEYEVQVIPNCDDTKLAEGTFTTLSEDYKVFLTEGNWSEASNWSPVGAPTIKQDVELRANATIESGCVALAKSITGTTGTNAKTLTIEDGGQLKHYSSATVTATVKKNIEAWTIEASNGSELSNGWYLIANPTTASYTPKADGSDGILVGDYDFYSWNYAEDLEWRNFKDNQFTNLYSSNYNSYGYLYANAAGTTLEIKGNIKNSSASLYRSVQAPATPDDYSFPGWYLMGNGHVSNAYVATANADGNGLPCYKMNATHDGFEAAASGTPIAPMEGFFYEATNTSTEYVYVTTNMPNLRNAGRLNMNLRSANKQLDNAIVVFGDDQKLGKMSFRENSSKIYIPLEGKDYAIVNAEGMGEMPVSFKAEKNGTYTLGFTTEDVTFSYLHLIDNLTGTETDLLATPSYSFDARTTDYASRFRLVFATGSSAEGSSFGFINAAGNFCVFGIEGEATLQVIDLMGRILSSESFSGSYEKPINAATGVYMVRLINGNDVKTQKVVVK